MASFTPEELALAQPEPEATAKVQAWYMDDSTEDQRLEHRLDPNEPCTLAKLREMGVTYWSLDADNWETDPKLAAIRKVHGMSYIEVLTISKDTLPDYENKLKAFYQEHIHSDDEIRYFLDGSGYFDIRSLDDRWVRICVNKGDLIIVPEGIYHRFTLDTKNYAKAMRLFVGEPVWTPFNRPQEEHPSRAKYMAKYGPGANAVPVSA
ncbi:hypothetical protein HYH03_016893 [Edaphochlamys debaryana]|uniref:Acireductone dioxygenase n=1 Tax=Edaphochlamys debaryana TaxID=47281 RepID=A0A835XHL4_9CHLO|nr:hypothetical protein HYH03_016893 [Edaphochlamys debaryana]|eukprot:KAG2484248.1 hypothetical protein HYH03_016893 [Edaphochlamys debaryana]